MGATEYKAEIKEMRVKIVIDWDRPLVDFREDTLYPIVTSLFSPHGILNLYDYVTERFVRFYPEFEKYQAEKIMSVYEFKINNDQ